jgi:hypothetical protein
VLYSIEVISKAQKTIETGFLLAGLDDPAQDVRKQVRACFIDFYSLPAFVQSGQKILLELKTAGKK